MAIASVLYYDREHAIEPGKTLTRMTLETFHGVEARFLSEFHDLKAVAKWIDAVSAREYSD